MNNDKLDKVERIIGLFERLKVLFFGKTDWVVKTTIYLGGTLITESFIITVLNNFFEQKIGFSLTDGNDFFLGSILILLGALLSTKELIYNSFIEYLKFKRWEILIPNFVDDFEKLNHSLNNYTMLFNEYVNCIGNKGNGSASNHDKTRVEYDCSFIESINRLEPILGKDITKFYYEMRKIISKPFFSEILIYNTLSGISEHRPHHIASSALKIYTNHFNAIKEINEELIKSDISESKFKSILIKYDIDDTFNTIYQGEEFYLAEEYILRRNQYI